MDTTTHSAAPKAAAPYGWRANGLVGACALLLLAACGGGQDGAQDLKQTPANQPTPAEGRNAAVPQWPEVTALRLPSSTPGPADEVKDAGVASIAQRTVATAPLSFNGGTEDPGLLMLLVPDEQSTSGAGVAAWVDAASETGTRIAPVTDAQFLAMGSAKAAKYAGLVLPDQLHVVATDELITAVRSYVTAGGRALLSYDFGALTLNGNDQPVYPIPKSRLSDLAGVDYVLYDSLLGQMVGLGPVVGMRSTLRELLVPPGKSVPYNVSPPLAAAAVDSASRNTDARAAAPTGLLGAAGLAAGEALYLPTSVRDPGGVKGFDPQQFHRVQIDYAVQPADQVRVRVGAGHRLQPGVRPAEPPIAPMRRRHRIAVCPRVEENQIHVGDAALRQCLNEVGMAA